MPLPRRVFCMAIASAAVVLTLWPDGLQHFRYQRDEVAAGELWRLLSAHLVHLNPLHLLLNLAGLALACELSPRHSMPVRDTGLLLSCVLGVSALLWYLQPEIAWYAGLSGVLHGLWVAWALEACWPEARQPQNGRYWGTAGLILLIVKLVAETVQSQEAIEQLISGRIIHVAHGYGAMVGILYWLALRCASRGTRRN